MTYLILGALALLASFSVQADDSSLQPGDVFKDCGTCPEMVVIPAGEFVMGARLYDEAATKKRELPQQQMAIEKPFALGRFEVTRSQYQECYDTGGCAYSPMLMAWERKKGADLTKLPIVHVSWEDAMLYVSWLSQKTGEKYSLPSEIEWEYAARGNTTTIYWWGDELGADNARCVDCGVQKTFLGNFSSPLPVGSFNANPFGLYDVSGNVAEIMHNCAVYMPNMLNKDAFDSKDCKYRSLRGGAFDGPSWRPARLSAHRGVTPYRRRNNYGFRVKKNLN